MQDHGKGANFITPQLQPTQSHVLELCCSEEPALFDLILSSLIELIHQSGAAYTEVDGHWLQLMLLFDDLPLLKPLRHEGRPVRVHF